MAPDEPPNGSEARLLWDMGEAVYRFVDRVFEGGLLCPSKPPGKKEAQDPSDDPDAS